MEVSDFEGVQMRTGHALSNEAAKHRISVKPKTRRLVSKKSFKTKEVMMHKFCDVGNYQAHKRLTNINNYCRLQTDCSLTLCKTMKFVHLKIETNCR